jgi:hypothetical protein
MRLDRNARGLLGFAAFQGGRTMVRANVGIVIRIGVVSVLAAAGCTAEGHSDDSHIVARSSPLTRLSPYAARRSGRFGR